MFCENGRTDGDLSLIQKSPEMSTTDLRFSLQGSFFLGRACALSLQECYVSNEIVAASCKSGSPSYNKGVITKCPRKPTGIVMGY